MDFPELRLINLNKNYKLQIINLEEKLKVIKENFEQVSVSIKKVDDFSKKRKRG